MKKYFIILIPLLISIGCFFSYNLVGSYVAEDGTLVEPFFLIPIGLFFFIIAVISTLVWLIIYVFKKK
jgi:hypothetical protein